jgi:hypothetical protein
MRIPGMDGGTEIEADDYVTGSNPPKILIGKLVGSLAGAATLLFFGIWIEAISTVVGIHVWIIDGVGAFLSELVVSTLGIGAEAQIAAWETAAQSSLGTPLGISIVLALEALVLYAVFERVRDSGVIP